MKFTIDKNLFLEEFMIVQKAVASKSNFPALAGVLIRCDEEGVTMIASNMDISIKVEIDSSSVEIEKEGACLVLGKVFGEIIKKLNGDSIEFELEEDNILRIQSGTSDITLNLLEVADYPKIKFSTIDQPIVVDSSLCKELIKGTTFASSLIDNKPILTGVNIRIKENKLLAVATDSFRLSKKEAVLNKEYLDTNIIIPAKSLNEFYKIIDDNEKDVEIHLEQNAILFKNGNVMFQTRLLEGNYPETSRLIPVSFPVVLKFDKNDILSAIDRVSTLSYNPNATTIVKMEMDEKGNATLISSSPELGTIKDEIKPVEETEINPMAISFSATYFSDALRAFYSTNVYVKFNGEAKPFIFEGENDEGLIELVLPIKAD